MPHGKGYPMVEDEDSMGGMSALMEMPEPEEGEEEEGKKKPASNFDLAADRAFAAAASGDGPGFRSALRSAIKIVVSDMT